MKYPKEMTTEAIVTVSNISKRLNLPLLETLQEMSVNLNDYAPAERVAYRVAMAGFGALFAEAA